MANGFTAAEMLDVIEQHILRVEGKLDTILGQALDHRVTELEKVRNRGTAGVIGSLAAALAALGVAMWNHVAAGK